MADMSILDFLHDTEWFIEGEDPLVPVFKMIRNNGPGTVPGAPADLSTCHLYEYLYPPPVPQALMYLNISPPPGSTGIFRGIILGVDDKSLHQIDASKYTAVYTPSAGNEGPLGPYPGEFRVDQDKIYRQEILISYDDETPDVLGERFQCNKVYPYDPAVVAHHGRNKRRKKKKKTGKRNKTKKTKKNRRKKRNCKKKKIRI